jgi:hypothetical protein
LAVGAASEEVAHSREEIGESEREETLGSAVVLREGRGRPAFAARLARGLTGRSRSKEPGASERLNERERRSGEQEGFRVWGAAVSFLYGAAVAS